MQVQALVDDARRGGFPTLMGADITQVYYLGDAATPVYAGGRECQLLAMPRLTEAEDRLRLTEQVILQGRAVLVQRV